MVSPQVVGRGFVHWHGAEPGDESPISCWTRGMVMGRVVQRIPVDGACIRAFARSQDGDAVFGGALMAGVEARSGRRKTGV